ncbi:MAG: HAD family phosphatase [Deltaproteobacteria bacterium]|nr:HAD family phosphatase [Deltaproteobacteria bacterium]
MTAITTLFWDVGGVLLTNGWPTESRRRAVEHFGLNGEEFEKRHESVMAAFETGQVELDAYLDRTLFYVSRSFSRNEFKSFMLDQSKPHPEVLALLAQLAHRKNYLLCTLNNESLELNLYRIRKFELRRYFKAFFSSCFLGVRKPDEAIYRKALEITQRTPEECLFIDDRPANIEPAAALGWGTIHYQDPLQLRRELSRFDVKF